MVIVIIQFLSSVFEGTYEIWGFQPIKFRRKVILWINQVPINRLDFILLVDQQLFSKPYKFASNVIINLITSQLMGTQNGN